MSELSAAVKVEEISPVKKKLTIDVPWTDVKKERDAVYRNYSRKVKIKGFRQGKIPRKILEVHYKDYVEEETISNLVNKFTENALKEHEIKAVGQPEIDEKGIEEEKGFSFSATFEVEPDIDPQGYLNMNLEKEELVVTDQEVDSRLDEIRKMFGTLEEVTVDREIQTGDFVTIDFEGSVEGETPEEMKRNDYFLEIGSKTMVPGFEDQLIGEKVGTTKGIKIVFPEDYQVRNVAGKEAEFTVTIKTLKEKKLPELDENFVKNFEKYESLDALKADVRKSIFEEQGKKINDDLAKQIVDKLLAQNAFDVPAAYVEQQIYFMIMEAQKRLISTGMDPQMIAQVSSSWRDKYREEAERIVKSSLLLKNIAKKEALEATDEELEARLREIAQQYSQDYEKVVESFDDNMKENVKSDILNKKIFEYIEQKADIKMVQKRDSSTEEEK
ncbi:MAG: Trigger factor [Syntrophus sp. PtaU1.Bin005]|uniref:trigger factor n=1 Tax=Syntrophus TaxID=43773 RepID=UPI0009CC0F85|nr:MAG: Trigger factor [Syntrophus sp. PtaU1.Bin005]